jgi:hypothetical protein
VQGPGNATKKKKIKKKRFSVSCHLVGTENWQF